MANRQNEIGPSAFARAFRTSWLTKMSGSLSVVLAGIGAFLPPDWLSAKAAFYVASAIAFVWGAYLVWAAERAERNSTTDELNAMLKRAPRIVGVNRVKRTVEQFVAGEFEVVLDVVFSEKTGFTDDWLADVTWPSGHIVGLPGWMSSHSFDVGRHPVTVTFSQLGAYEHGAFSEGTITRISGVDHLGRKFEFSQPLALVDSGS